MSENTCKNCKHYGNMTAGAGLCQRHPPVMQPPWSEHNKNFPTVDYDDFCGEFEEAGMGGITNKYFHPPKEEPKQKEYPSMNTYQCPECGTLNGIFTPNNKWCSFKCNKCHNYLPFKEWQRFILKKQPPKEEPKKYPDLTYACPGCGYRHLVPFDHPCDMIKTCQSCKKRWSFFYHWKRII